MIEVRKIQLSMNPYNRDNDKTVTVTVPRGWKVLYAQHYTGNHLSWMTVYLWRRVPLTTHLRRWIASHADLAFLRSSH